MRKSTTESKGQQQGNVLGRATRNQIREQAAKERLTIGLDLGDGNSSYCILNEQGETLLQNVLPTTQAGLGEVFAGMPGCRIALEVGTHSP
jgi:transposase